MQRSCEGGAYMIMLNHACLANADTPRCFEAESYPTCRPRWPTAQPPPAGRDAASPVHERALGVK